MLDPDTGAQRLIFATAICYDPATLIIGLTLASGAIGAVGAIQQGQAAKAAGEYNAAVADRNAAATRDQTSADVVTKARERAKHLGEVRAAFGANGLDFSDSALDVFQEHAVESELDIRLTKYKGDLKAQGYNEDAVLERMNAKASSTAGYIGAGSALIGAGAKAASFRAGSSLNAA